MSGRDEIVGLSAPPADRLPDGFAVALDRRARRLAQADGGTALLGLSPGRLLYLSAAAARLLGPGATLTVADRTSATLARRLLDAGIAHPVPALLSGPEGDLGESTVTVVVPVKDRPAELRRLLDALRRTAPGIAEVIVVDDGSTPPLRSVDEPRDPDAQGPAEVPEPGGAPAPADVPGSGGDSAPAVRVVRHEVSRGPAAARNTGLAAARTELVAFLDSDAVPEPGWLTPLRAHLADPSVALAAPRIVALDRRAAHARPGVVERYERLRSSLDLGPDPAPVVPRTRVAYVPSAALLVRRAALGRGFDERMHVAEDVDLGLRLHAAGWRLRYEPSARVAHEHRTAPAAWWARKAFYGTGAAPLADRHPGSVPPMVLAPWAAAVCGLAGLQRRWGMAGAAAVTGVVWWRLRRTLSRLRDPGRTAALLVGLGVGGAAAQTAGVLTRHWWPIVALGCLGSRRLRRAVLVAALAEGGYDWWTHRDGTLDPVRYLLLHRADDLGYGTGLWWGALRRRTPAPLLPTFPRRTLPKPQPRARE